MELLKEYWVFLAPVIFVQFALSIAALVHVLRHPRYRFGSKMMWIPIVLLIGFVGPIFYFAFGRGEDS